MNQRDLDRAVARATGESVHTISAMGFVPLAAPCAGGESAAPAARSPRRHRPHRRRRAASRR